MFHFISLQNNYIGVYMSSNLISERYKIDCMIWEYS